MKMMLVCENDADKKEVARIFEQMTNELAQFNDIEANYWEGGTRVLPTSTLRATR